MIGKQLEFEVLAGFIDGKTGVAYSVGDVYRCTKKRYNEINDKGVAHGYSILRPLPAVDPVETNKEKK